MRDPGHLHEAHVEAHAQAPSTRRVAFDATRHCLTGCAIGEVLGLVVGTTLALPTPTTIGLAVVLAFLFGYALTLIPLLRAGLAIGTSVGITVVADTLSITVMEIVDNAVILLVPGAMEARLFDPLFWASLAFALVVAFVAAYPVNFWLIRRGLGHAIAMRHHDHH